jgi:hypothetical protein
MPVAVPGERGQAGLPDRGGEASGDNGSSEADSLYCVCSIYTASARGSVDFWGYWPGILPGDPYRHVVAGSCHAMQSEHRHGMASMERGKVCSFREERQLRPKIGAPRWC